MKPEYVIKQKILYDLVASFEKTLNIYDKDNLHKASLVFRTGETSGLSLEHSAVIRVDGEPIFRESYWQKVSEEDSNAEEYLIDHLLSAVFDFGMITAKQNIDKRKKMNAFHEKLRWK